MNLEIGRNWHTLRLESYRARWHTLRGENPPQGIPYRCIQLSYGSRCVQIRLWNWRKHLSPSPSRPHIGSHKEQICEPAEPRS